MMRKILMICLMAVVMTMSFTGCQDEFDNGDVVLNKATRPNNVLKSTEGDNGDDVPPPPTGN